MHTARIAQGPHLFRVSITYSADAPNPDLRMRCEYLMTRNRSRWAQRTAVRKALELHNRTCRDGNPDGISLIEVVAA